MAPTANNSTTRNKDDAAMRIARALVQARADFPKVRPGGVFTICDAAECIRKQLGAEFPEVCKVPRVLVEGRDEVFDALCIASGYDLAILTRGAAGRVAKARADILRVSPQATATHVAHVAKRLAAKFSGAPVTPTSIASHWAEFGTPPTAAEKAKFDPYKEPRGWQDVLRALGKAKGWDAMSVLDYSTKTWTDLPLTVRQEIVRENNQ
jgi:hypothetical protein